MKSSTFFSKGWSCLRHRCSICHAVPEYQSSSSVCCIEIVQGLKSIANARKKCYSLRPAGCHLLCERNLVSHMMSALAADLHRFALHQDWPVNFFVRCVTCEILWVPFSFFAHLWLTAATCLLNTISVAAQYRVVHAKKSVCATLCNLVSSFRTL